MNTNKKKLLKIVFRQLIILTSLIIIRVQMFSAYALFPRTPRNAIDEKKKNKNKMFAIRLIKRATHY